MVATPMARSVATSVPVASISWTPPVALPGDLGALDLACPTTQTCIAVDDVGHFLTWNGTSWSAPESIDGTNALTVSCSTVTFYAAAGNSGNALVYDGSNWSAPSDVDATSTFGGSPLVVPPSMLVFRPS